MPERTTALSQVIKQFLFGRPLRTAQFVHQRLANPIALAVFASDNLSSNAYATEEMLLILTLAGSEAAPYVMPIAIAIFLLIAIVAWSYRQTIHAYPTGGGAYIVAKENLGHGAGMVAGAALLVDYVLTVAVSVAAGVAALSSAAPFLHDYRVALAITVVLFVALMNLRGTKESGALFAFPTYGFIITIIVLLILAAMRYYQGEISEVSYPMGHLAAAHEHETMVGAVGVVLILRAFASGCVALTGIEAVSNGVMAFRPPEATNAGKVLLIMAAGLGLGFLGITFFTLKYGLLPYSVDQEGYQTIVSQLAEQVFRGRNFGYWAVQAFTSLILLLAANTAFADFPRLASIMARDSFLPRQFGTLGDKLVFTNGIVILAALAILLLFMFEGDTHLLIPLYSVGVFLSFTLSQTGMVMHWRKEAAKTRSAQHVPSMVLNAVGAILTFIVLLIIGYTKFRYGAWIVMLLIPLLVMMFRAIHHHYGEVAAQLSLEGHEPPETDPAKIYHTVIVPIGGLQWSVVRALQYAKSLSPDDVRAVYVNLNQATTDKLVERWSDWGLGIPLIILESPYRSILEPLLRYVDFVKAEPQNDFITVLLPEFVTKKTWQAALHNQTAIMIRTFLGFREGVVVTSVRFHLEE